MCTYDMTSAMIRPDVYRQHTFTHNSLRCTDDMYLLFIVLDSWAPDEALCNDCCYSVIQRERLNLTNAIEWGKVDIWYTIT